MSHPSHFAAALSDVLGLEGLRPAGAVDRLRAHQARSGVARSLNASTVSRWLTGARPADHLVPHILALTNHTGRKAALVQALLRDYLESAQCPPNLVDVRMSGSTNRWDQFPPDLQADLWTLATDAMENGHTAGLIRTLASLIRKDPWSPADDAAAAEDPAPYGQP